MRTSRINISELTYNTHGATTAIHLQSGQCHSIEDTILKARMEPEKNFIEEKWNNFLAFIKPDKWAAEELLQFVKEADYEKIAILIEKNPHPIFIKVNDIDGSPLQYALGICDIFTLIIFYNKVKSNSESLSYFKQQAENQKATLNLEFLYKAYEAFKQQYRLWESNLILNKMKVPGIETVTEENWWCPTIQKNIMSPLSLNMYTHTKALCEALEFIATAQCKLPIHFLKEMCRKESVWNSISDFDLSFPPPLEDIVCYMPGYKCADYPINILPLKENNRRWIVLTRSRNRVSGYSGITNHLTDDLCACFHILNGLGNDLAAFFRLYEQRIKQVEEMKKQLSISDFCHTTPSHFTIDLQDIINSYTNKVTIYNKRPSNIQKIQYYTELTPEQAEGYLNLAVNTWVFQGQQMINGVILPNQNQITRIPVEIYFHILSFLTGCSLNYTKTIFDVTNKRVCDEFIYNKKHIPYLLFRSQKSKIENIENIDPETEKRYQNRIRLAGRK